MSIQKIASLCKKEKTLYVKNIVDREGTTVQWIGIRDAVFPLAGMPIMDAHQLFTILGIESDKQKDYEYDEITVNSDDPLFSYYDENTAEEISGIELCRLWIQITMNETWTIFKTSDDQFLFANDAHLKPVDQMEMPRYFLRGSAIICKNGLLNYGLIGSIPVTPEDELIQCLKKILDRILSL